MSLIHDALKSMDAPAASAPVPARTVASKEARTRPAWVDGSLAFAAVMGVGAVGWFVWQSQLQTPRAPKVLSAAPTQPVPVPDPQAPLTEHAQDTPAGAGTAMQAAAVPEAVPVPSSAVSAGVQSAAMAPVAVAYAAAKPSVDVAPAPVGGGDPGTAAVRVSAASSVAPEPVAQPSKPVRVAAHKPVRPATVRAAADAAPVTPAPVVDETPVELRFARFVTAMKDSRTADAQKELTALAGQLPAGSIGLLRAQAWFDLRAGDQQAAESGYRAILDRMPGDEEAAINLASIQSQQQKTEDARATLDAAARLQPDSSALRAALAQFNPTTRQ